MNELYSLAAKLANNLSIKGGNELLENREAMEKLVSLLAEGYAQVHDEVPTSFRVFPASIASLLRQSLSREAGKSLKTLRGVARVASITAISSLAILSGLGIPEEKLYPLLQESASAVEDGSMKPAGLDELLEELGLV